MENKLLFQIEKLKNGKIVKTYKIFTNGDIEGFDAIEKGIRYTISNFYPCCLREEKYVR